MSLRISAGDLKWKRFLLKIDLQPVAFKGLAEPSGHQAQRSDTCTAGKQLTGTPRRDDPLPTGRENYASRSRTRLRVLSTSQPLPLPAGSQCDAPRAPTVVRRTIATAISPGQVTSKGPLPFASAPCADHINACTHGRPSAVTSKPYRGACHPSPGHDHTVHVLGAGQIPVPPPKDA